MEQAWQTVIAEFCAGAGVGFTIAQLLISRSSLRELERTLERLNDMSRFTIPQALVEEARHLRAEIHEMRADFRLVFGVTDEQHKPDEEAP